MAHEVEEMVKVVRRVRAVFEVDVETRNQMEDEAEDLHICLLDVPRILL